MEYADEPRLVFSPLSERDYCGFYALEMDSFAEDAEFYISRLRSNHHVLELGCGTGRLSRLLAPCCEKLTAIDISGEMIRRAALLPIGNLSCRVMDMTSFSFPDRFDIIVIPYNTLNLLGDEAAVKRCLRLCREYLFDSGKLLLHLYHPDRQMIEAEGEKFFQFAIFNAHNGDKVIKETLRHYLPSTSSLILEERYRVRPHSADREKRDLRHTLSLYAPQPKKWNSLLQDNGFSITTLCGSYGGAPFSADNSLLLVEASPA